MMYFQLKLKILNYYINVDILTIPQFLCFGALVSDPLI